jgi:tetratricopeptide (TPR) repeat protein
MPHRQLAIFLLAFAAMLVYYAWLLRGYLRKRRLRRQLLEEGRVTTTRSPDAGKKWVHTLVVVAAGVPLYWACERYVKPVAGDFGAMAAFCGVGFAFAFPFILWRNRTAVDGVLAGSLRQAKQGDVDGAVQSLRAAMSESPSVRRAGALGQVLADAGRWEEAVDAYREARRLCPDQPIFTVNVAVALAKSGRAAEALPILEEARRVTPEEAGFAAAEAIALASLGRTDEAVEQHRQAKELMEAVPGVQRLDMWTLGTVLVECAKAVEEASTRGFPVVAPAATLGAPAGGTAEEPKLANVVAAVPEPARNTGPTA